MDLEFYREIHPNWQRIANLSEDEAEATLDLLLTAAFTDKKLTEDEVETLTQEWSRLPFVGEPVDRVELNKQLHGAQSYLKKVLEDPSLLDEFLTSTCSKIQDEETQIEVFRLVAMTIVSDGVDEAEFELCYAIGHHFDLTYDTVDQLLDSIWESHQKALDTRAGEEHNIPPLKDTERPRQSSASESYPNPFNMNID